MYENKIQDNQNYLKEITNFLKNNIIRISIVTIILSLFVGVYAFFFMDDTYDATSSIIVEVSEIEHEYTNISVAKQLVDTYSEFSTTALVLNQVISDLSLDLTSNDLKNLITVDSSSSTIIINFIVNNIDAELAASIANALVNTIVLFDKDYIGTDSALVLDYANVPTSISSSNASLYTVLGILVSFMIGVGISIIYKLANNKVSSSKDMSETLDVNVLGTVLDYKYSEEVDLSNNAFEVITKTHPESFISEEYHKIRAHIDVAFFDTDLKVISLTSANPKEGKTITAINLANIYAGSNQKTLLIDLDLRTKSKICEAFNLNPNKGITDYFDDGSNISDYIVHVDHNLDVIHSGKTSAVAEEIFISKHFKSLIDELRKDYDKIIIDCPPMNYFMDAEIISMVADGTVFVARSQHTEIENARVVIDAIKKRDSRVLGIVVTYAKEKDVLRLSKNFYN